MISEEKAKIYDIIIKGFSLKKDVLFLYGISDEQISDLILECFLEEKEDNKYSLVSAQGLYEYGLQLLGINRSYLADECFRICLLLEPDNRDLCMQLLITALNRGRYVEFYQLFEAIRKIEPIKYQRENNLYLFLLGQIITNSKEYMRAVLELTKEDVIGDDEYKNIIIEYIMDEKYKRALTLLNDKIATSDYDVGDRLLKELLIKIIDRESKLKKKIFTAIKEKRYSSIVYFLDGKQKRKRLNQQERIIYLIAKEIISILETRTIKYPTVRYPKDLYEAVLGYNFYKARSINISFLNRIGKNVETDIIYLLLENINALIKQYKDEQIKKSLLELLNKSSGMDKNLLLEEDNKMEDVGVFEVIDSSEKNDGCSECGSIILEEEEIANYIIEMNIPLNVAFKSLGLFKEQMLIIKLIYARNYYTLGTEDGYMLGDKLVLEVERDNVISEKVLLFLNEVKVNRNIYAETKKSYSKRLVQGDR